MGSGIAGRPQGHAQWGGRPIYGYDSPVVQESYTKREAANVAAFLLPHLRPGMNLLDCGCGPGAITLGLAEFVSPGRAVGIDLEPAMVARAENFAKERQVENIEFQVADIGDLPFPDSTFDVVYTSAVLEHLADPERALVEIHRTIKPGGLIGAVRTDWGEPLISPSDQAVAGFFELFERGFNLHGGSLNRGRHLRSMIRAAGFEDIEFSASFGNSANPETVLNSIDAYIDWMDNLPLFEQAIELCWADRPTLDSIKVGMRQWARGPDAFLALGRCEAVGRKSDA